MTKSAKKKKEKFADFTKPKLKLGKGKQPAANAVDTSFKARSIVLPQQSITSVKDASVPTTKKRLTLEDLLTHLKHHNAGIRKDALLGLRELLEGNNTLLESSLMKITNACARLISDEDASVRNTLHRFLAWILPQVERDLLLPHAPTLLLFTVSAQTNIFPEIRVDAIRILDILLETIPDQIADGLIDSSITGNKSQFGKKFLDGYLGLLSAGARFREDENKGAGSFSHVASQPTSLVMLSTASKALILKSFSKFLSHAFPRHDSSLMSNRHAFRPQIPLWYLSSSFSSQGAFESFIKSLFVHNYMQTHNLENDTTICFQNDENVRNLFPLADLNEAFRFKSALQNYEQLHEEIGCLASLNDGRDSSDRTTTNLTVSLCRTVQPILVSCFLDYAPSVFSPTQPCADTELELLLAVVEIARCLYGYLVRDDAITQGNKQAGYEHLRGLLGHMAAYFPFGESRIVSQDLKADYAFQRMNLLYCELFTLVSFASVPGNEGEADIGPKSKRRKLQHSVSKGKTMSADGADKQLERVRGFVLRCLQGIESVGTTTHPLGRTLSAQGYVALLPTLWWLLGQSTSDSNDSWHVLDAILQHAMKTGSTSAVKCVATEFVAVLVLLQTDRYYKGSFCLAQSPDGVRSLVKEWLIHLPKVLSDLVDKNISMSEYICNFILKLIQRKTWLYDSEVSVTLCTRLSSFFLVRHATHGELLGAYPKFRDSSAKRGADRSDRIDISLPSRRLPLDVAAALVSHSYSAHSSSKNRNLSRRLGRSAVSGPKLGTLPIVGSWSQLSPSPEDAEDAADGLRFSVGKSVVGTEDEGYWKQVSSL